MPIYQTNIWVCEVCGKITTTVASVSQYDDPVVFLPESQWEYVQVGGIGLLACPQCQKITARLDESAESGMVSKVDL